MSSSTKQNKKRATIERPHLKHTFAQTKEITRRLKLVCDDSSPLETDSTDLKKKTRKNAKYDKTKSNQSNESLSSSAEDNDMPPHKNKKTKSLQKESKRKFSSSDSEDSENNYDTQKKLSKEYTRSDKHKGNTKRRKGHSVLRSEKNKNKESECSDSEAEVHGRGSEEIGPVTQSFISLLKEEADSSSGKEFQSTKLSRTYNKMKKSSETKGNYTKSNLESAKATGKSMISEKQCIRFKCCVTKILNKFKEVCSDYELRMESVKWKHLKKELVYQESAKNIIDKTKDVISKLKVELDSQEKELVTFYNEWYQKCNSRSDEDSSSSESESLEMVESHDKLDQAKNKESSPKESTVSECDNEEIFSGSESEETRFEKDGKRVPSASVNLSEKPTDDDDEIVLPSLDENGSPILGSTKKKKASVATHLKSKLGTVDANKGNFAILIRSEDERMNDSLEDMFGETIENAKTTNALEPNEDELDKQKSSESKEVDNEAETAKSDSNEDINLLKNKEHTTESVNEDSSTEGAKSMTAESLFSQETLGLKTDDTESTATVRIEKSDNNSLDGLSEEERAKKALLESDSESFITDESSSEKSNRVPAEGDSQQNCRSQFENVKSTKADENKSGINSVHENDSSNQQNEIDEAKVSVERTPLHSNLDNSVLPSSVKDDTDKKQSDSDNSENMHAKAKLLISSNSENSSSDSDEELQTSSTDSLLKNREKKENSKKDILKENNADSDISISERVKMRRTNINSKCNSISDEKLKMQCRVNVKRLSKKILKKYEEALSKSRQYLKDKKIDSLIDVDKLNKDSKTSSNSPRNALSNKKTKAAKQEEDSLMDHLKKVENGEFRENIQDDDDDYENGNPATKPQATFATTAELMMKADDAAKKNLLNSDSDIEMRMDGSENSSSEKEEKPEAKDTTKKESSKKGREKESSSDKEKSAWRRNKLLTMKLSSDSDSDAEREKWNKKKTKLEEKTEENDIEHSDAKDTTSKPKRRPRRKILDSDSDGDVVNLDSDSSSAAEFEDDKSSDSSPGKKKPRKRKTHKSSSSDSSLPEKKSKQKRKRIKNVNTDSDSDDNDKTPNSQGTPGKKGRKNIRKVIKDKQVADDTKQAAKEEEERLKRIAERQKLYNEMYEARLADEEKVEKLVLDFDPETKEELISVHTNLVKRLKPHQAKGIKFMWDSCFESLERMKSSSGSGCIIAHCMGLGKTLQVITLIHTLLANDKTGIRTVMVVCPLSTVLNWVNEFKLWLKDVEDADDIEIYELTKLKQNIERKYQLESWQRTGGVLIIGYEMFRNLTGTNNKMRKSMKEAVLQYLVDPGPDLIVCDEGHLLKNEETALSKCMKRIKTLRRIVLTGTPLQNNLTEYHCMVQFVKPSLLGTKKEFLNRFVNPITNGQFDDSTESDVKIMKKRAYVLHKMLKGCVQRFDYSVLTPFLPPKQEYVIFVRLTDVQIKMYRHYLDNFARQQRAGVSLFADFQALQRIWTHPVVLRLNAERVEKMNEKRFLSSESEGSLKDFIHDSESDSDSSESSSKSDSSSIQSVKSVEGTVTSRRNTRSNNNPDLEAVPKPEENEKKEEEWWSQFTEPEQFEDLRISAKLVLLFSILKESEQIGDKVLVFSQSLYSLTLIEQFLEKIDNETQAGTSSEYIDGHSGSWSLGLDYFRLDGQTSAENRSLWCKIFNQPSNSRARLFLISTRAGGLGINLTGANRVIIFDASWNPSHDVQSIFRVYRFGQKKPCYVYRFLAAGTMEEKIYNRQVTKLSLACRVVDEQQIERHYSNHDLSELYNFDLYTNMQGEKPTLNLPKDRLLAEIFSKYKDLVENYHEHDSLLENKAEEELDEEERKQAWLEYEEEKKGKKPMMPYQMIQPLSTSMLLNQYNVPAQFNANMDYEQLKELIRKDYPNSTPEQQQMMATRALSDMYSYWEQQTYLSLSMNNQNAGMGIRSEATSTAVPTTMSTAMPAVRPTQMGMQAPNLSRYPVMQNTNMNVQIRKEFTDADPKSGNVDDDVIEVSPTTTNKSKNQEE